MILILNRAHCAPGIVVTITFEHEEKVEIDCTGVGERHQKDVHNAWDNSREATLNELAASKKSGA